MKHTKSPFELPDGTARLKEETRFRRRREGKLTEELTFREVIEQSAEKLRKYHLIFTRLSRAHRAYSIALHRSPAKRIIKRLRYYAKRLHLQRQVHAELTEASADCAGSEALEQEVLMAMNKKLGTPGFGSSVRGYRSPKDQSYGHEGAERAEYRALLSKKHYARSSKKLEKTKYSLESMLKEVPAVPSDSKEAMKILMEIMSEFRDVVEAVRIDYTVIDQDARLVGKMLVSEKKRFLDLKDEARQILQDMVALRCDVRTYVGAWVDELLKTKSRHGRPKS